MTNPSIATLHHAAQMLEAHPDFRVLRRLQNVDSFYRGAPLAPLRVGVAVDVETTGLDHDRDRIIELAAQRFRFDALGRVVQLGQPRVWREDPEMELDPRITMLTGLTDQDLAGQSIDEGAAVDLLASADITIAHNAGFDRPFVDRRLPALSGKPWACSMVELDWLALGFEGKALSQLVSQCGWFYAGHRAENDILALIHLLAHSLPDPSGLGDHTILSHLMAASEQPNYRINAVDAPFEAKDALKAKAYRWDGAMRFWWRSVAQDELEAEIEWLRQEVYAGRGAPAIFPQSACDRYRKA
ncbi:DNA polymerase III subunit epsilon [Novosphingobium umbonatum]|uniref:DNA polymerase III subunit epsilon n=1 Tax=Novosphingobium umbonatum TaxID=1908524 RepID=A0A3S2VE52_9SPHN|nr:3'-5' exonuclease [Novosphingobium umbonatum]RVU05800.1 DNA polymerase III subunit epsilon [Novosphingobium umbonatum]